LWFVSEERKHAERKRRFGVHRNEVHVKSVRLDDVATAISVKMDTATKIQAQTGAYEAAPRCSSSGGKEKHVECQRHGGQAEDRGHPTTSWETRLEQG
jgi:hypothetical protein